MTEDRGGCVYRIVHRDSGRFYIGHSANVLSRFSRHARDLRCSEHHCIPLQRAWKKYGEEAFYFEILSAGFPVDVVVEEEQAYLDEFLKEGLLFNTSVCANRPPDTARSPEARARVAEKLRGSKRTPEQCKRISDAKKAQGFATVAAAIAASALANRFRLSDHQAVEAMRWRLSGVTLKEISRRLDISEKPLRRELYALYPDLAVIRVYTRPAILGDAKTKKSKSGTKPWLAERNRTRTWTDEQRRKISEARKSWYKDRRESNPCTDSSGCG